MISMFKKKRTVDEQDLEWKLEKALIDYYHKNAFQRMPRAMIDHYMQKGLTEHRIHQVARRTRKRFKLAHGHARDEHHATELELMAIRKGVDSSTPQNAWKLLLPLILKVFPKHGSPKLKKFIVEEIRKIDAL